MPDFDNGNKSKTEGWSQRLVWSLVSIVVKVKPKSGEREGLSSGSLDVARMFNVDLALGREGRVGSEVVGFVLSYLVGERSAR